MTYIDMSANRGFEEGLKEWKATPGALLLDCRTEREYATGHIAGSINMPMGRIKEIEQAAPSFDTPLFVHCLSGARSARVAKALELMGYTTVKNIGGINDYNGELVL